MESFGFIHGELDTKILILYVLRRLPRPVEAGTLSELCSFDSGVGWFDYADCLAGLVDTGHVEELPGERYVITDKGRTNGEAAETSLPYSVRMKADRLLERFGIARFCDQYPQSFSRGMREKLACTLALACRPDLLLLDEPTGPLDPASADILEQELGRAADRGCAVLLSCHHRLERLKPDRVLVLRDGTLETRDGAVAEQPDFWKSV